MAPLQIRLAALALSAAALSCDHTRTAPGTGRRQATGAAIAKDDVELRNALWVEGRVVLPVGTPPDEHVEVLADGKRFETRDLHRAPIGPDGSFRVAFAEGTGIGLLTVHARYSYLDPGRSIEPAHPPERLALEAKLGGIVRGRLIPPENRPELSKALAGCRILAMGKLKFGDRDEQARSIRSTNATDDLRFELTALPPQFVYEIRVSSAGAPALGREGVEVSAGGILDLDLSVRLGAEVRGRITFDGFWPADDAEVSARTEQSEGSIHYEISTLVDSDGSYTLSHIQPGLVTIIANCCGHPAVSQSLGVLADGEKRVGVDLQLQPEASDRGGAVR